MLPRIINYIGAASLKKKQVFIVRGSSGAAALGREAGWWCEVYVLRCVDGTTFVLYYINKNMSERLITGAGMVLWGLVLLVGAR